MGKRVLVVDDEEDIRSFVRLVLESSGYDVETAENGSEGLRLIQERPPDLVILDLMMPVMDGWEVLTRVGMQHPPLIVVLSAAADPERARREGAAATLKKPFRVPDLLAACQGILGE